jgi:hypothetical protein
VLNIFLRDYDWAQSKPRSIDDETLIDLLKICEYQAGRSATLDELGIEDRADPTEVLYSYVLDALGVPPDGAAKFFAGEIERFSRECHFSRDWFEELFYSEYLLNNAENKYSLEDLIALIRQEITHNLDRHYK